MVRISKTIYVIEFVWPDTRGHWHPWRCRRTIGGPCTAPGAVEGKFGVLVRRLAPYEYLRNFLIRRQTLWRRMRTKSNMNIAHLMRHFCESFGKKLTALIKKLVPFSVYESLHRPHFPYSNQTTQNETLC